MALFRRLGKLEVQVAADTSSFTKGMREVSDVMGVVRGGLERFTRLAGGVASAVANVAAKVGGLSAAIAGGGFAVLTTRAFKTTGALSEMSRQLGVTIADLARAKQTTILAGESTKAFDSRIEKLSSQLRNAGDKAVMFKAAIQSWVADLAKGGSEADRFGLVVDDAFGRMVERANIAARRLREAFVGRFRQIAVAIAPFVEFAANKLTEFVTAGTTDFGLVDKGMMFLRDTIAEVLALLEDGKRLWLEFKVAGLEVALAVADAIKGIKDEILDLFGVGPNATGPGKAWSTFEPRTEFLQGLKAVRRENPFPELSKALKEAQKELAGLGEKPKWADRFTSWWDQLIKDARENMKEFGETRDPPELKDFKLPQIRGGLAPSLATGSAAAAQARFQATTQVGGAEASLRELVSIAMLQQSGNERRTGLLDDIRRALENKTVITMGT